MRLVRGVDSIGADPDRINHHMVFFRKKDALKKLSIIPIGPKMYEHHHTTENTTI